VFAYLTHAGVLSRLALLYLLYITSEVTWLVVLPASWLLAADEVPSSSV